MYKIDIRALQSSNIVSSGFKVHIQAYTCLRHIVQEHIASGITPLLLKSLKLISGYKSVKM